MPKVGHRSFFLRCRRCSGDDPECTCCSGLRGLEEHRLFYVSFGGESFGPFSSEETAHECSHRIEKILPGNEEEKNVLWTKGTHCTETMGKLLTIVDEFAAQDPLTQALIRLTPEYPGGRQKKN